MHAEHTSGTNSLLHCVFETKAGNLNLLCPSRLLQGFNAMCEALSPIYEWVDGTKFALCVQMGSASRQRQGPLHYLCCIQLWHSLGPDGDPHPGPAAGGVAGMLPAVCWPRHCMGGRSPCIVTMCSPIYFLVPLQLSLLGAKSVTDSCPLLWHLANQQSTFTFRLLQFACCLFPFND